MPPCETLLVLSAVGYPLTAGRLSPVIANHHPSAANCRWLGRVSMRTESPMC